MPGTAFLTGPAVEFLLARGSLPVLFWLKKDVLDVPTEREFRNLCKFGGRMRILETQRTDGSWLQERARRPLEDRTDFLIQTLKNCFHLYDYACPASEEKVRKSMAYLLTSQTREGDFRASSSNEYSPGFHALTLEILCKFGLSDDARVGKGFRWLMSHRQKDGGWAIPCRTIARKTVERRYRTPEKNSEKPFQPVKSKPFSHFITGIVLRALGQCPAWRTRREFRLAAELVLGRFFREDVYEDRRAASHWEELAYPFWSTNILSCLDTLAQAGFRADHPSIVRGLDWLASRQNRDGYWASTAPNASWDDHLWVTFAVLRVFKRFGVRAS